MENISNMTVVLDRSIDPNFAGACLEAVGEVLKITTGSDATYQDEKDACKQSEVRGFQGKIKLSGDWIGELIVAVPYALAAELATRFVGCSRSDLSESDIGEGIGEIANQIAGRVATMLSREDLSVGITIPQVIVCSDWHHPPTASHALFQFECINLPFHLIVSAVSSC